MTVPRAAKATSRAQKNIEAIYRRIKYPSYSENRFIEQDEAMGRKETINIRFTSVYMPDETTFDISPFA